MYIFTWNPNTFEWIQYLKLNPVVWSSVSRKPKVGDRFVFMLQGMKDKNGIIGFGKILKYELSVERKYYYSLDFEKLWNYEKEEYPKLEVLKCIFPKQLWTSQSSGIFIKKEYQDEIWNLLKKQAHII